MLNIGNKTFMNLQEAVGWLLENNALPFQSTANYVANTEIAMSTLVNPSPAKVRVGSLIFFADSKVSTVVGVTSNSFIVSDQYNDLVDDVVYVSNVAINASGHLICTLSNGNSIDAGLIKQVSGFSIDASQHLIVTYNDGSSTDLGAIFNGNVNIAGNLTADSIIENMSGYSFTKSTGQATILTKTYNYVGAVKNGNKLTLVVFFSLTMLQDLAANNSIALGNFVIPASIGAKLFPYTQGAFADVLDFKDILVADNSTTLPSGTGKAYITKGSNQLLYLNLYPAINLVTGKTYNGRIEATFLLSDSLVS